MSDAIKGLDGCRYDAKENLDLSQTPDAFKTIVQNNCPPNLKSVTEKPSPATKTAEAPRASIPASKISGGVTPTNEKIKKELESFSETAAATYEALKNIEKTYGVSVVQNFERAKYEAKLNGVSPEFNNTFVKGFLREYAVQMYSESKSPIDYSKQIDAGNALVKLAKQNRAARGPLPHGFETGMGPITPGANLFAINNPVDYKKLADFCQKNDVNLNGLFDKAELEASQMADKKYQPAYLTGYFKELISLIEKNDGKISKDMDRVFDKQLNNAGEQAAL
jgi:hypothetical protein